MTWPSTLSRRTWLASPSSTCRRAIDKITRLSASVIGAFFPARELTDHVACSEEPVSQWIGHRSCEGHTLPDSQFAHHLFELRPVRAFSGQHEMGVSPVRVDFDRFAQALDPANHTPEVDIGKTDEEMPLKEERIARAEAHRILDMAAGLPPPPLGRPTVSRRRAGLGSRGRET